MPTVAIENPEIMTVSFRQTRNDKDYGSCLWASEIEEFPMAVTKIRFGND